MQISAKAIFYCFFLFPIFLVAQDFEIKGKITDNENTPLESATVYLEKAKDSTLVSYTITDVDGNFVLEDNTEANEVNLNITYTGFTPYTKKLQLNENRTVDLGQIQLKFSTSNLDEIVLQGDRAPVTIKTDTLEFNAASFKTKDDANLEAVLEKLPGVQVDAEGNITVNGKPVSRILVNGKEFFGDDPKIATKNLPKEIINKIQVVDTKTKSEEFTGKEGDSENKTINITIDEDKNKGFFSRLTAGGGTDGRYELSGIANYFKNEMRVSILGSSNNINSSGFSFDEVFDAMGRSAYSISGNRFGGGSGITKSDNIGFNLANEWADDAELNANYFFNRADNVTRTKVERENILPDRRFFNNSTSSSQRQNDNHRSRVNFEFKPDTLTRISFRPSLTVNNGFSSSDSFTESFEEDGTPINNAVTNRYSEVFSTNFSNRLNFTRKFGNKGAYVRLGVRNNNNYSDDQQNFFSSREVFEDGVLESTQVQDQLIEEESRTDAYAAGISSRIPIVDEKWFLDIDYEYDKSDRHSSRLVYEKSQFSEDYNLLNENLSNEFESETFEHQPSLGLVYRNDKLRASATGGLQNIRLKNENTFTGDSFDNTFNNLYSRLYFRYKINKTKSVYFSYRNSQNAPSINQLQPVTVTTNPLNIVTGNPNLDPSLEHRFYANFNNYDFKNRSGLFAYFNATLTDNQVVSFTTTDEDLVRTTTYTNVSGAQNISGGMSLDKTLKLKNENTFKIETGIYGNYNKRIGFSNTVRFNSKTYTLTPNLGLEINIPDVLTVNPEYSMNITQANYSLNNREESFTNHTLAAEITSFWPKNVVFGNDISYRYIGNVSAGFDNSYILWNMSLGYKVLGDDGIFKVKVFDVLNENISTSRTTGEDFIQDTEQLVLEQYVMFSFTYKLSKFGGKDPNNRRRRF